MKKLVMAAAVVGAFAGTAQAQTSVTLYGIADGDVRFDHTNIGTLKSIDSGGESGTRWGIRGTEDLGGGLKANFIFEQGFDLSDNSVAQGAVGGGASGGLGGTSTQNHGNGTPGNTVGSSRLFGRVATVGLSGNFGEVRFGRGYSPIFLVQATADPFGAGFVSQVSNIYVNNNIRNDNAVYYDSPRFAGIQFSGVYQFGESTTNTVPINSAVPTTCTAPGTTATVACTQAKRGNDRFGASLSYAAGPIFAGVGYEHVKSNLDTYSQRNTDAAVTYDFGFVKLHALYWGTKNDNPVIAAGQVTQNERALNAGVTVPFGAWTFMAQYGDLRDKSTFNNGVAYGTPKVHYPSAGLRYSLSKRTILYAGFAKFVLKTGAQGQAFNGYAGIADASNPGTFATNNLTSSTAAGVSTGLPNVNPYSYQFGIRHSF